VSHTKEQKEKFLNRVSEIGNVSAAASLHGITPRTGHRWIAEEQSQELSRVNQPKRNRKFNARTDQLLLNLIRKDPSLSAASLLLALEKESSFTVSKTLIQRKLTQLELGTIRQRILFAETAAIVSGRDLTPAVRQVIYRIEQSSSTQVALVQSPGQLIATHCYCWSRKVFFDAYLILKVDVFSRAVFIWIGGTPTDAAGMYAHLSILRLLRGECRRANPGCSRSMIYSFDPGVSLNLAKTAADQARKEVWKVIRRELFSTRSAFATATTPEERAKAIRQWQFKYNTTHSLDSIPESGHTPFAKIHLWAQQQEPNVDEQFNLSLARAISDFKRLLK